jgi:hypothetical protein
MTVTTIPTTVMSNKRQQSAENRITTLLRLEGPQSMQMIMARSRGGVKRNMSALNYTSRRRHWSSAQKAHLLRNVRWRQKDNQHRHQYK